MLFRYSGVMFRRHHALADVLAVLSECYLRSFVGYNPNSIFMFCLYFILKIIINIEELLKNIRINGKAAKFVYNS